MTEVTRRERIRAGTELEIRQHARVLLIEQGREAVTLRAIARELGITAPALYRYYDSREDLLRQLCDDICHDLAEELAKYLEGPRDQLTKVFTVCREFRRWALEHPQEFTLVFATPPVDSGGSARGAEHDQFGAVFFGIVGPLMAEGEFRYPPTTVLRSDLPVERATLASAFTAMGIDVPPGALQPGAVYGLLRWWVRLYGHVALEVFGRFPFDLTHADRLFETLLAELADDIQAS